MDNRIEALVKAFQGGDASARRQAAQSVALAGAVLVEPLIAALEQQDDPGLRRGAAYAFTHLRDPRAVTVLIVALENRGDNETRLYAAQALAAQRDARAIEPLIGALRDSEYAVNEEAVRALGEIGEAVASPRIIEVLDEALSHADWGTRQSAAEMLIRLEAELWERAERLLLADLDSGDAEIRLGAAASLVELADGRALEPLVALLYNDDVRIATNAALVLGKLGDQRAVLPLTATLNHPHEAMRDAARKALRQLHAES
jgi:HEAT repeat protein